MSGTRFARTGRCRFIICFGILVLMVGMVAIFHSSQIQLDETREQRLHCEQQQEALNERLTTLVEQKFHLEKSQDRERTEYLETKRNLEQKIKDLEEKHEKEQIENQMRYDKLQQAHKLLQSDHKHLKEENLKANKQQMENINGLESKLQSLKSELMKEKSNKSGELYMYKEKYNTAEQERQHVSNSLAHVEKLLDEYKLHCDYKPQEISRKPVAPKPDIARDASYTSTSEKSFNHQEPVSDGVYQIPINISNSINKEISKNLNYSNGVSNGGGGGDTTVDHLDHKINIQITTKQEKTQEQQQQKEIQNTNPVFMPLISKKYNGSLIINSVENFQIVAPKSIKSPIGDGDKQKQVLPLSAPKNNNNNNKPSTASAKSEQQLPSASALNAASLKTQNGLGNGSRSSSSSTSNTPPLHLPLNQRKQLPENVAPIPDGFEDILQKSNKNQDSEINKDPIKPSPLKSSLNNNNNNNYDFGAQEMKDNDNLNDEQNLAHDEDIFDSENEGDKEHHKQKDLDDNGNNNNDDDDGGGLMGADNDNDGDGGGAAAAGDIAVKHNQQQMIDESLKNEIADDQGKEFGDGLRLEEGAMEEDDDDDYSNPSARKKADKAVRH